MQSNAGCSKLPLIALGIVTIWLTGCATGGSEVGQGVCLPVVEYDRATQQNAVDEIAALPQNAVIVGWLADYSVMRAQARSC